MKCDVMLNSIQCSFKIHMSPSESVIVGLKITPYEGVWDDILRKLNSTDIFWNFNLFKDVFAEHPFIWMKTQSKWYCSL